MADQVSDLSARVARMLGKVPCGAWSLRAEDATEVRIGECGHAPGQCYPRWASHPPYKDSLSACLRDVVPWLAKRGYEPRLGITHNGPYVGLDADAEEESRGAYRSADMREATDLSATLARLLCECALEVAGEEK